jgi:hypothetical protein
MTGREITVHRVGTPAEHHAMTVEAMRDYLTAILAAHEPTGQCPEARIEFPGGFWIDLTTSPGKEAPRP